MDFSFPGIIASFLYLFSPGVFVVVVNLEIVHLSLPYVLSNRMYAINTGNLML